MLIVKHLQLTNNEIIEMFLCVFVKYVAVRLATLTKTKVQNKSLDTSSAEKPRLTENLENVNMTHISHTDVGQ